MIEHKGGGRRPLICDAQVHAPDLPHIGMVSGIDGVHLLAEMDVAGVDRCVLVPLERPGADEMASNEAALKLARAHPDRFAVMGCFELRRPRNAALLADWLLPCMLGIRVAFVRDPNRSLLANGELDWFWAGAASAGIPLMVLAPGQLDQMSRIAQRHPELRLVIDHLGLAPHVRYDDIGPLLAPLRGLARFPNVALKASALPCSVIETFPFPGLREPIARLIDWFGPDRVFWGSDLTRLPCSYSEMVRFFLEEVDYGSPSARELMMGAGILRWIGWDPLSL